MLRVADLVLFLAPFLAFIAWRSLLAGAGPSPAVLAASLVGLAVFGAALVWLAETQALPAGSTYVPAHVENGRIAPGRGAAP